MADILQLVMADLGALSPEALKAELAAHSESDIAIALRELTEAVTTMSYPNPVADMSAAIGHAVYVGLADAERHIRDFEKMASYSPTEKTAMRQAGTFPVKQVRVRPQGRACKVVGMFLQVWGSTALGFGGVGGQAVTTAYTVLIEGPAGDIAVYWAGQFAYRVTPSGMTPVQREAWRLDLARSALVDRATARERYASQPAFKG